MNAADALTGYLAALDALLAAHGEALTERSIVTLTRRPGLLTLTEADIDDGERLVLVVAADVREPQTFGQRIDDGGRT